MLNVTLTCLGLSLPTEVLFFAHVVPSDWTAQSPTGPGDELSEGTEVVGCSGGAVVGGGADLVVLPSTGEASGGGVAEKGVTQQDC